jgi:hypothetical protein
MIQEKKNKVNPRHLLMGLPVVVLPLLAFVFHSLGGGGKPETPGKEKKIGINTSLPDAQFGKDEPADKMAYYDRAVRDSAQLESKGLELAAENLGFSAAQDAQSQKISEKLAAINQQISAPYVSSKPYLPPVSPGYSNTAPMAKDVDRLEALMKNMQEKPAEDAELVQLSGMMDKLLAVQNPDLARQLYKREETVTAPDSLFKAIPAVIATNQKARQGAVVELRLQDSIVIGGQMIPKGHLIYGLAGFSNQRLNLEIKNIRLGTSIIPVNLTVFDQRDGMPGINAPEALLSEAAGAGASDAIGSVGISGFDLTTQIAGAGIDAAKNLFTKKIKRVKQTLKAGYPLLLKDNSKKKGH